MKRFITTITLACAVIVFGPTAVASATAPPPVTVDAGEVSTVVIAAPVVTIIVSLLIPLVNGFLTKASTPSGVKAVGTIVLNAVSALFVTGVLVDGTAAFSTTTLYTAILGCVISITTYAGVYRPLEVTSNPGGKLASIGRT
jgi:uncharacterized membrane protein YeaQ/YmgE (transglycosylase-associated protein family)